MKKFALLTLALTACLSALAATLTPIENGKLKTDLDAGGKNISNANTVTASSFSGAFSLSHATGVLPASQVGGGYPWSNLTGVPLSFTPTSHDQAISTITGLSDALGAMMPRLSELSAVGTIPLFAADGSLTGSSLFGETVEGLIGDVANIQSALSGKQSLSERGVKYGYPYLDGYGNIALNWSGICPDAYDSFITAGGTFGAVYGVSPVAPPGNGYLNNRQTLFISPSTNTFNIRLPSPSVIRQGYRVKAMRLGSGSVTISDYDGNNPTPINQGYSKDYIWSGTAWAQDKHTHAMEDIDDLQNQIGSKLDLLPIGGAGYLSLIAENGQLTSSLLSEESVGLHISSGSIHVPSGTTDGQSIAWDAFNGIWSVVGARETSLGNPSNDGYVLSSTAGGVRSWVSAGAGDMLKSDNLSGLSNAAARSNLGLGAVATANGTLYDTSGTPLPAISLTNRQLYGISSSHASFSWDDRGIQSSLLQDFDSYNHGNVSRTNYINGATNGSGYWATVNTANGGNLSTMSVDPANHNGCMSMLRLATSSASNGAAQARGSSGVYLDKDFLTYESWWRVKVSVLSNAADEYEAQVGLTDATTSTHALGSYHQVSFHYSRAFYGNDNWRCVTRDQTAGSQTVTDSGIAASTAWQRMKISFDRDAGVARVRFWLDGALVATHTTNIPAGIGLHERLAILKSAGTNGRSLDNDFVARRILFNSEQTRWVE